MVEILKLLKTILELRVVGKAVSFCYPHHEEYIANQGSLQAISFDI
jgi:hypothetical protein